ncbi:LysR family transcriptional regulator [Pseudophaeobacter arcticus]|uniref:LysR family transcriptional regulator n=1 Tax=Pseudophaeobacter arcticus TaxID=385492 RepID=UPI0004294303|nr:LysR family transcriptional regulator [Pseudophaeobacter arcticus]
MLYLTLRHYEYTCAVAQHGSLSAAAQALNVSQPALSTALARIEDHLGQALFVRRRGTPLSLTPQGRDFAKAAQKLLQQASRLETPDGASPVVQNLVIGCFSDLAPFVLAPALRELRQAFPDLTVTTKTLGFAQLISGLLQGEIDLAVTYDLGLDAGFTRRVIDNRAPLALLTPDHELARHSSLSLAQLAREPLVLSQEGLSVQHMLALFKSLGLTPRISHRAASLEVLRSLAANGEGVGISYSAPPITQSYDGKAIVNIPVRDSCALEPVIITSHGAPKLDSVLARALDILSKTLRPAPPGAGLRPSADE